LEKNVSARRANGMRVVVVVVAIAGLLALACRPVPTTTAHKSEPARLESIDGSALKRVVLTEEAAERLGIRTTPVREQQAVRSRTVGGEVISLDPVVLRVRATPSDLERVDRRQPARIRALLPRDSPSQSPTSVLTGRATDPPEGAPALSVPALYYAVEGAAPGLAIGQRMLLELPLTGGDLLRKVVPYSAVIYDLSGATWTYTRPVALTFVRYRISVDYIEGNVAILSDGPTAGTEVVSVGATELFGAESKVGK
jgi:hypothetical protein